MTTVLLCTVGGSPQPIVHAIQQNRPDLVWFLCSGGTGQEASAPTIDQDTASSQPGECPKCGKFEIKRLQRAIAFQAGLRPDQWLRVVIDNPDDLDQVWQACEQVEAELGRRYPTQPPRVIANYTGGTKTMTLGLGAFALRAGWELQVQAQGGASRGKTVNPRSNTTKILSGDLATTQDVFRPQAADVRTKAEALLARHDYDGAVQLLETLLIRLAPAAPGRDPLDALWRQARLMAAWDRFDHATALQEVEAEEELKKVHRRPLKELLRTIELYQGTEPWPAQDRTTGLALVRDLLDNATRCASRQRFDDAAARLYRTTELLAQLRLLRRFGVRTGDVPADHPALPEPTRAWVATARDPRDGKVKLGLFQAYRLLAELGDPLGSYFTEQVEVLHGLIKRRNDSILAHGLRAVTPEDWLEFGPRWQAWLDGALAAVAER